MAVEKRHIEFGTPATFQKYTFRSGGLVGGVPHSVNNLLKMHSGVTRFKGFFNTGDTVFPGQGNCSCYDRGDEHCKANIRQSLDKISFLFKF